MAATAQDTKPDPATKGANVPPQFILRCTVHTSLQPWISLPSWRLWPPTFPLPTRLCQQRLQLDGSAFSAARELRLSTKLKRTAAITQESESPMTSLVKLHPRSCKEGNPTSFQERE